MPRYLVFTKYSATGIAGLRAEGYQARQVTATKAIESLGGTVESFLWMDQSDADFAAVLVMPSFDALMGMLSIARASGAFDRTTFSEVLDGESMDRAAAGRIDWRAPGQ